MVMVMLVVAIVVVIAGGAILRGDVPDTSLLTALSKVCSSEVRHGKLGTAPGEAGILLPPPPSSPLLSLLS